MLKKRGHRVCLSAFQHIVHACLRRLVIYEIRHGKGILSTGLESGGKLPMFTMYMQLPNLARKPTVE